MGVEFRLGSIRKKGVSSVEVVFTILHAGGKFGGGGYKVSGGLHGVGSSVVNALSDWLEVTVCKEGHIHKQRYERGKVCYPLKVLEIQIKLEQRLHFIQMQRF